jgi:hypothetical protein
MKARLRSWAIPVGWVVVTAVAGFWLLRWRGLV